MKYYINLIIVLFATTSLCFGQDNIVSGHVFAFKETPLNKIVVTAKKSKKTTLTDSLGNFSIECKGIDKLTFTGHGFKDVYINVKINDNKPIKIKMVLLDGIKNKVLAINNMHIDEVELDLVIKKYQAYNTDYLNFDDVFEMIRGKFSGVQIINRDGTKKIIIRGGNSLNLDNGALYVVDGQIVDDISFISPIIVKTITIDREGAIYGSRGANGVVIITTHI